MDFKAIYSGLAEYCAMRKAEYEFYNGSLDGAKSCPNDCIAKNDAFIRANFGLTYETGSNPCGFEIAPCYWKKE